MRSTLPAPNNITPFWYTQATIRWIWDWVPEGSPHAFSSGKAPSQDNLPNRCFQASHHEERTHEKFNSMSCLFCHKSLATSRNSETLRITLFDQMYGSARCSWKANKQSLLRTITWSRSDLRGWQKDPGLSVGLSYHADPRIPTPVPAVMWNYWDTWIYYTPFYQWYLSLKPLHTCTPWKDAFICQWVKWEELLSPTVSKLGSACMCMFACMSKAGFASGPQANGHWSLSEASC